MTKIKIIGDPGKHSVEIIKEWLEESLKKFKLNEREIHLVFVENVSQLREIFWKYGDLRKAFIFLSNAEIEFTLTRATAYLPNKWRREKIPIILVKKGAKISKDDILDEVAHIVEDKIKWMEIESEAFVKLREEFIKKRNTLIEIFYLRFEDRISDFFSDIIKCQFGLSREVFEARQEILNKGFITPLASANKIIDLILLMDMAFFTFLPQGYFKKEEEEKLEKIVIKHIRQMGREPMYEKIKSIVSKLESTPRVSNIYKVGSEIIELAQEFLEK